MNKTCCWRRAQFSRASPCWNEQITLAQRQSAAPTEFEVRRLMVATAPGDSPHSMHLVGQISPRSELLGREHAISFGQFHGNDHGGAWCVVRAQTVSRFILSDKRHVLFAPLRFIWNATRGHRLAPWRSQFLRWRVETYSGKPAETLKARDIFGFVWTSRWELLSFLVWTGRLEREARRRV